DDALPIIGGQKRQCFVIEERRRDPLIERAESRRRRITFIKRCRSHQLLEPLRVLWRDIPTRMSFEMCPYQRRDRRSRVLGSAQPWSRQEAELAVAVSITARTPATLDESSQQGAEHEFLLPVDAAAGLDSDPVAISITATCAKHHVEMLRKR